MWVCGIPVSTMRVLTYLYVVLALALNYSWGDDECVRKTSQLPHNRLEKDLLCDYDSAVRPIVNQTFSIDVTMTLVMRFFTYDMDEHTISVHGWMILMWVDEHLRWDPSKYNNISEMHLDTYKIWTPDLVLYNKHVPSGNLDVLETSVNCVVSSSGRVICVVPLQLIALCLPNLEKYPYDRQKCVLKIASWVYNGEEINLKVPNIPMQLTEFTPNEEWKLLRAEELKKNGPILCCPNISHPFVTYTFEIERHSATRATALVVPGFVMIIMTLTTLWMDPALFGRLALTLINIMVHFTYLESIAWQLPSSGDSVPLILVFYRDSLLLCAFSLVLAVILKALVTAERVSPSWISYIIRIILSKKPGQILLLSNANVKGVAVAKNDDDTADVVTVANDNTVDKDWILFAKFLDRICFVSFLIVYFRIFICFLL